MEEVKTKSRIFADYKTLYDFFIEKGIEMLTFESISANAQKKFQKQDFLSVGTLITILLRDNDLSDSLKRLCAFYVLFDLFKGESQLESPFATFLLHQLDQKDKLKSVYKMMKIEYNFIGQLINNGTKELAKQTPTLFLQQQENGSIDVDYTQLLETFKDKQKLDLPVNVLAGIPKFIKVPDSTLTDTGLTDLLEGLCNEDSALKSSFFPPFYRVPPPLLPVENELVWLDFTNPKWHEPYYDMNATDAKVELTEQEHMWHTLLENAYFRTLTLQEKQILLDKIQINDDTVEKLGLSPSKLPLLVENNPIIAIEVLLKLMNTKFITEYFNELVNMDMSLHSMEVVNRLTTSVDLPPEFIQLYVSNCISACESNTDKYMQTRFVRLLCVFLQSLIRNKVLNVNALFIEVESFCISFSNIRDAATLYRLLKQMESADAASSLPSPMPALPPDQPSTSKGDTEAKSSAD